MTDYAAEDFATARFAAHPAGRVAARHGGSHTPWYTGQAWLSDERMTSEGWIPVTSRGGADVRAWQKRERLKRHIEDVEATLSRRNDENDRLRAAVREAEAERDELRARPSAIGEITLDTLQAAWEGAEQGEVAEGDVLIRRSGENFTVWAASGGWSTEALSRSGHTRILHRAPKPSRPEGAERLEAMLRALVGDPALLADWLAARGVPVTEEEGGEK